MKITNVLRAIAVAGALSLAMLGGAQAVTLNLGNAASGLARSAQGIGRLGEPHHWRAVRGLAGGKTRMPTRSRVRPSLDHLR